ncbi:MAG: hypothetical protein K0R59_4291 [Sphingobacterium sp.]|jgi:hypothetical protein|nr:hypothetical protein [Sphingobacterium sp.]
MLLFLWTMTGLFVAYRPQLSTLECIFSEYRNKKVKKGCFWHFV